MAHGAIYPLLYIQQRQILICDVRLAFSVKACYICKSINCWLMTGQLNRNDWCISGWFYANDSPCSWLTIKVVLDGEIAVPCNPQPAIAGLNSRTRFLHCTAEVIQRVLKVRTCATKEFRTPSGSEDSSGRKYPSCAAEQLDWSPVYYGSLQSMVEDGCTAC